MAIYYLFALYDILNKELIWTFNSVILERCDKFFNFTLFRG